MSDFTGTSQREGGKLRKLGEGKNKKGMGSTASAANKRKHVQSLFIRPNPPPPPIPARTEVTPDHTSTSDCDLILTERLGNHIWLADSQQRFLANVKKALVLVRDRERERITLRGEVRTNE